MNTKTKEDKSIFGKGIDFIKDSNAEIKKVSYPTKQETIQATMVCMIILSIIAGFLAIIDIVFNKLMQTVI